MALRGALFRCLDDCKDLTDYLAEAKKAVLADGDPTHYLQLSETKLQKVNENFDVITKEIDNIVKKDTEADGTLP